MTDADSLAKNGPGKITSAPWEKLLAGRDEAAKMLSISCRALDYLVANRQISARRIGARMSIPVAELTSFSRADHPSRLVG
jgi:hypothetical protein